MSDRYYIVSVTGFKASAGSPVGAKPSTSHSVLDSCYAHREVFTAYAVERGPHSKTRLAACERERDRLNALDRHGPQ